MVRTKEITRNAGRSLIAALLLWPVSSLALPFNIGQITQAQGEISFLDFTPPHHRISKVKVRGKFLTDGSYLTKDNSFLTVQFFDGSWMRLSPRSKVSVEFGPDTKTLTVHLFTGSIKVLISTSQNDLKVEKLLIKSADALFESAEGKFTVVRNPVSDLSSVYVEKGMVLAMHNGMSENKNVKLIHQRETTSLKDRSPEFEPARKMTDKEVKFLHPSYYLKNVRTKL